ncbi:MAG: DUF3726 domain-containing protein [Pseudomonadota bacterium]
MSHAIGEIRSLAMRAARGAGLSWGLAEDAGHAVAWLEARGAPGATALADLVAERAKGTSGRCPILAGAAALDTGSLDTGEAPIDRPLLVVPFLAAFAPHGGALAIGWAGVEIVLSSDALSLNGSREDLLAKRAALTTMTMPSLPAHPNPPQCRAMIDTAVLAQLNDSARRLLAPSDALSRATGAGGGA